MGTRKQGPRDKKSRRVSPRSRPSPERRGSGLSALFARGLFRRLGRFRRLRILEEGVDLALQLDRHRLAVTVHAPAGGDADPSLGDAIFLDVGAFLALEADSDTAAEQLAVEKGAARIERK